MSSLLQKTKLVYLFSPAKKINWRRLLIKLILFHQVVLLLVSRGLLVTSLAKKLHVTSVLFNFASS